MITDQELDRLVDGELDEQAYRDVLRKLEMEPDGWRRCALAFLERQAWERELSGWTRQEMSTPPRAVELHASPLVVPSVNPIDKTTGRRHVPAWMQWMAAAVVGFLVTQVSWPGRVDDDRVSSRSEVASDGEANRSRRPAERPTAPKPPIAKNEAIRSPRTPEAPETQWTVILQDGYQTDAGDWAMPVYNSSDGRGRASLQRGSNLPESLEAELRRAGHVVRRQRAYTPVELHDGRQLVIPWEQVEIVPVSHQGLP